MLSLRKTHPRYDAYTPTGIDWLGDIPSGWEVWKLKWLASIETGNTPPKSEEENYSSDGTPWIKPDNLNDFVPLDDSKEKLSPQWLFQARLIRAGSVLVCGIGTIGKIGIAGCDLATNQQINSVTFNRKIDEKFGQYMIYASQKEMERNSNKVVVSILNKSQQSNLSYPVPSSLEEQTKIADYLDRETALLDTAVALKRRQIDLLREHRTALIDSAVTRGLDPSVEMRESGVEWIGRIPSGWEVRKLKYASANHNKKATFSDDKQTVALENVESWTGRYIPTEWDKTFETDMNTFRRGDVLFGKLRPYLAKVYKATDDGLCVGEFLVLRPSRRILQDFLYYRLISSDFITQVNNSTFGAKMPRADWSYIGNLAIPLPPLPEQTKIVDHLDHKTAHIDTMIAKIEKSIQYLEEYRTSLISYVVSGKVRII